MTQVNQLTEFKSICVDLHAFYQIPPEEVDFFPRYAAFDNGRKSQGSSTILKSSWSSLKLVLLNSSESFESFSSKKIFLSQLINQESSSPCFKMEFDENLSKNRRKNEKAWMRRNQ